MQANQNSRKMESSFTPYEELKQSGVFENSNIGINALVRLISSNKLTADSIQNYAKPVLKERLDVLYGMSADDTDGYKQIITNLPYMTRKADEIYDLVFVDMPKSIKKKSIMDTVADAEIVVPVINQDIPAMPYNPNISPCRSCRSSRDTKGRRYLLLHNVEAHLQQNQAVSKPYPRSHNRLCA